MNLSDILYSKTAIIWKMASEKPFLIDMATGKLSEKLYRNYMLQDYLYLQDYIKILEKTRSLCEKEEIITFLDRIISDTKNETYLVHVPSMKKLGIEEAEIESTKRSEVIVDYVNYMNLQLEKEGLLAGLTALLQCSWNYAYLGTMLSEKYKNELIQSPYKSWFDAYSCKEYVASNQLWIDVLDKQADGIDSTALEKLCKIFVTCAEYENKLWDDLYSII